MTGKKPTRESITVETIPERPVRAIASEIVLDVDAAISRIQTLGIELTATSRLHQARQILVEARDSGKLAPIQRGDDLGLRALETALDFHDIAATIPSEKDAALRKDLEQALRGPLDPPERTRGPLQLQSQLVIRSAFVRAGLLLRKAGKPRRGVSVPDIILENGGAYYAIEVKRPQSARGVLARFDEGSEQIRRFGTGGGVIIDVTDCVRGLTGSDLDEAIRAHALALYDRVWTGVGYRPGYGHIMIIGTVARPAWTSADGESSAMVNVHSSSTVGVFASHQNNLSAHRARWIRTSLQNGIRQLGMTSREN